MQCTQVLQINMFFFCIPNSTIHVEACAVRFVFMSSGHIQLQLFLKIIVIKIIIGTYFNERVLLRPDVVDAIFET